MMLPTQIPGALIVNPVLSQWVEICGTGVCIKTGKVELGQGAVTGIAAIAAAQLGLTIADLDVVAGDVRRGPDEGYTVGSMSIEEGGSAIGWAAALARELFAKAAAERLGVPVKSIELRDGRFSAISGNESIGYVELRDAVDLSVRCDALPRPSFLAFPDEGKIRRMDFQQKFSGSAFLQDIDFDGLCYGSVLRSTHPRGVLASIDRRVADRSAGVIATVIDGRFVGVVSTRLELAAKAVERLRKTAVWRIDAPIDEGDANTWISSATPVASLTLVKEEEGAGGEVASVEAAFSRSYLAHASIGPSAAIATWRDGRLHVVTHSQGVFPLRSALARALRIPPESVDVAHAMGAGCYGHNGADDVALDAALLARASGHPVMCVMSRQDELCWSPFGAAMRMTVRAAIDAHARIVSWRAEVLSAPHVARPGSADRGINLLAATEIADAHPADPPRQLPGPAGTGDRNAVPLYRVGARDIRFHLLPQGPLRSSSIRSLGAHCNVFAIESVMDELASRAAIDPIAFRCNHLDDPRAIAVLHRVAGMAQWSGAFPPGEGRGRGIGFARYKNRSAYCAIVAEVSVDESVRVHHVYAAVDCGAAVHKDGVLNQIEGGIVQAVSWTLKEQVSWTAEGFANRCWEDYPIIGLSECPTLHVEIIDRSDDSPLGVGECATGPTAAAIGNAVANALSLRIRDLPITRARIISSIEADAA